MDEKLKYYGIDPEDYFSLAVKRAKELGLKGELSFVNDGKHKMEFNGVKFGSLKNKDYIIYLLTEGKEVAERKRKAYHARMFSTANNRKITDKMKYTLILW
jgi:hypothetical protein